MEFEYPCNIVQKQSRLYMTIYLSVDSRVDSRRQLKIKYFLLVLATTPEILRRALGSPQCDSSSSCDNTLRKTASLKSFPHLPGSHREVKEAVGVISEECRLNLIGLKS